MVGPRILVVDGELICDLLRNHFHWDGFVVRKATNGRAALTILDEAPIDAVVSDVTMPEIDGPTLVRTMRARGLTIPVVLLSGDRRGAELALAVGAAAFVPKPMRLAHLSATVRSARSNAGGGNDVHATGRPESGEPWWPALAARR
jgi:DNA-binding response OmpR family regulator